MNEKKLLKYALLTSILGIIALFFLSFSIQVSETNIEKLHLEKEGEFVKIKGKIIDISSNKDFTIIKLNQETNIDVIVFSNFSVEKGKNITIEGRVSEFNRKKQIIADKIILN